MNYFPFRLLTFVHSLFVVMQCETEPWYNIKLGSSTLRICSAPQGREPCAFAFNFATTAFNLPSLSKLSLLLTFAHWVTTGRRSEQKCSTSQSVISCLKKPKGKKKGLKMESKDWAQTMDRGAKQQNISESFQSCIQCQKVFRMLNF